MILAVPFTVFIKIVCENIPSMNPVAIILGNKKSARRRRRVKINKGKNLENVAQKDSQ